MPLFLLCEACYQKKHLKYVEEAVQTGTPSVRPLWNTGCFQMSQNSVLELHIYNAGQREESRITAIIFPGNKREQSCTKKRNVWVLMDNVAAILLKAKAYKQILRDDDRQDERVFL